MKQNTVCEVSNARFRRSQMKEKYKLEGRFVLKPIYIYNDLHVSLNVIRILCVQLNFILGYLCECIFFSELCISNSSIVLCHEML